MLDEMLDESWVLGKVEVPIRLITSPLSRRFSLFKTNLGHVEDHEESEMRAS